MQPLWRPPAALALLLLASVPFTGAQSCVPYFDLPEENIDDYGTLIEYRHPTATSELAEVATPLLSFGWTEGVFSDPIIVVEESDTDYLGGVLSDTSMLISTMSSLEGLPDYQSNWAVPLKTEIQLTYNFPVIDGAINITVTNCEVSLRFTLLDLNTVTPFTDVTTYFSSLREDFPLSLTIPYLEVIVQDFDGTSPNNELTASFDVGCPLATTQPLYDGTGQDVIIMFMLKQKLDYDSMEGPDIICQVTISDGGIEPSSLFTSVTITVTVEGFEDEPPVFQSDIYTSTLDSQLASQEALVIVPADIQATDADIDGSPVVYSMTAATIDGPEWDDYFAIDASTAAVTVVQDIPDELLGGYSTHFVLTATDGNSNFDTSILEIVLPTAPTTSTTSTSTSTTITTTSTTSSTTTSSTIPVTTPTTTPCTTPTTMTPTTDTCPPCPTSPVITTDSSTTSSATSTISTSTTAPATSVETVPPDTCPPCSTVVTDTSPPCTTLISDTCPPCSTVVTDTSPPCETLITDTCPPCSTVVPDTCPPCSSVVPDTCPPCSTEMNTCATLPTTVDSSESGPTATTTAPSTEGANSTFGIVTGSTESGQTEPVCQTCDPCECTSPLTQEPDGSSTTTPAPTPSTATPAPTPSTTPPATTAPETDYMFERATYNFQVYTTSRVAGTLKVVTTDGLQPDVGVSYAWDNSASNGTEKFPLDSSSGQVSVEDPVPGYYVLKALAEVEGYSGIVTTDVYITVLKPPGCDDIFIPQGLIYTDISESTPVDTVITVIETQDTNEGGKFCKVGVYPVDFDDSFSVSDSGELILTKTLDADADDMQEAERSIAIRIMAIGPGEVCPDETQNSHDIGRNEVIVVVRVDDVNDKSPVIVKPSEDTRVGYPSNKALQEVVGPVVNIEVKDVDTVGDLKFTLSGADSDIFHLEETTGNLYLTDYSSCSGTCQVTVTVSDGVNDDDQCIVTVVSLDTEDIFDITFDDMTTSDIENEIQRLSNWTSYDLHLLYTSVAVSDGEADAVRVVGRVESSSRRRQKRDSNDLRDSSWKTVAHIYGYDEDGNYVSLEELNRALPDDVNATTFSEKETFSPSPGATDVTGYQVAVGILGGLLAAILIGAVVGFFWYRKKKQQAPKGARENGSTTSSRSDNRRVSVLSPTIAVEKSLTSTAPVENIFEEAIYKSPFDSTDDPRPTANNFSDKAPVGAGVGGRERKSSQHSLGGLHRIDPGPAPDGTKSSPYLTGSEGDFQASRPIDDETVASYTAYKGGQKTGDSPKPIKVNTSYAPAYKKEPYVSFGSTSEIVDADSRSREESGASSKKSGSGYGVSVRAKKEPPDVTAATPARPIMKKKSVTAEVHQEPEAPVVPGSFSKLQSSPAVKKKKKTKLSSSSDEDTTKNKEGPSESGASDSETKKSVAFKVLVDEKEIERINQDDDSGNENF